MTVTRSQHPGTLACGTTVSRRIWRLPGGGAAMPANTRCVFLNHNAIGERFKQNSPNSKSIRLLLWQNWRSTVLALVLAVFGKKKIGRFSFQIGRSGDFHYFIKNRKISRKIGRLGLGSSALCDCLHCSLRDRVCRLHCLQWQFFIFMNKKYLNMAIDKGDIAWDYTNLAERLETSDVCHRCWLGRFLRHFFLS